MIAAHATYKPGDRPECNSLQRGGWLRIGQSIADGLFPHLSAVI